MILCLLLNSQNVSIFLCKKYNNKFTLPCVPTKDNTIFFFLFCDEEEGKLNSKKAAKERN